MGAFPFSDKVIPRRDAEDVLAKAAEAARAYRLGTGVGCAVLDGEGKYAEEHTQSPLGGSCAVCALLRAGAQPEAAPDTDPCRATHLYAARQALRFGGSFVYLCSTGFMHWTSPLLRSGRLAGVLIGGPVLTIDREDAVESVLRRAGSAFTETEASSCVDSIPNVLPERVRALASLLQSTAESVSGAASETFGGAKRRTDQQARLSEQIHALKGEGLSARELSAYPIEKERELLTALRRGDNEAGRRILNELLGMVFFANTSRLEALRFRATELFVILSRAAMETGSFDEDLLSADDRYLRRIQEALDAEELTDILHLVVDRFSRYIFSFRGVKHAAALRRAERFIRENYVHRISLEETAAAAGLSAPYFSSVFKEEMGEGFSDYVNRLRVDEAARLLVGTDLSLSEVAGACGFEDQSWFSKTFKRFAGASPGKYRERSGGPGWEAPEIHGKD